MRKIFLYGPPGSGKTTIGKILANKLNVRFVDIDDEIELSAGMPIPKIIADLGEQVFRDIESAALTKITKSESIELSKNGIGVIALGGGALLRDKNRDLCERVGDVVYLNCENSILLQRLANDAKQRPLLSGNLEEKLTVILNQRKEHYGSFNLRVNVQVNEFVKTDPLQSAVSKTAEQIAWEIQKGLGRYHVRGMGRGYDVIIEPGGLMKLGQMLKEREISGPIAIVCDENVERYYSKSVIFALESAGFTAHLIVVKHGEENKTLNTVVELWRGFLKAGLDRKSTVLALGGGVVGDLAGFAASTFMRGCKWVVVPTTLLSMVDASLGGKTGFDLPEGKNLIGAFHSPSLVLADPDVLITLPDEELRSGLAEVVKHGVISDPELFELCSHGFDSIKEQLVRVVRSAMAVKIQIIEQDPFEAGIRAALNLGHTVGHAIEVVSHFQLRHGEAVAIGMVIEARLSEKLGISQNGNEISQKIKKVLTDLGLPTEIPTDLEVPKIIQAMKMDKKRELDKVKFALPVDFGNVKVGVIIADLEMVL